jgi:hypothetical protein
MRGKESVRLCGVSESVRGVTNGHPAQGCTYGSELRSAGGAGVLPREAALVTGMVYIRALVRFRVHCQSSEHVFTKLYFKRFMAVRPDIN